MRCRILDLGGPGTIPAYTWVDHNGMALSEALRVGASWEFGRYIGPSSKPAHYPKLGGKKTTGLYFLAVLGYTRSWPCSGPISGLLLYLTFVKLDLGPPSGCLSSNVALKAELGALLDIAPLRRANSA